MKKFTREQAVISYALLYCASIVLGQSTAAVLQTRDPLTDVDDFTWIKTWSAIGDSFTAGIGSGKVLKDHPSDIACSRYDYSYPSIMNRLFGASVSSFTYSACTGAVTAQINDQINALPQGQDLVVLTAGGNDLCITNIIKKCILDSMTSESFCDSAINLAISALKSFLFSDIDNLLTLLDAKMNKNSIVVFSLYAQYFNDQTDHCGTLEDWTFPFPRTTLSLSLNKPRRTRFNSLVDSINTALKSAVISAGGSSRQRTAMYVYSDWDPWLPAIKGHFCEDGASPSPADPSNANVQFFKLNTQQMAPLASRMRRDIYEIGSYGNVSSDLGEELGQYFYGEPIIEPAANMSLEERATGSATCPKGTFSLPDSIGKIFHPNQLGHETMASFAIDAVRQARAKILGLPDPDCAVPDSLTCYQSQGLKNYATAFALYSNTADFCKSAAANTPANMANWQYTKSYNVGTPDENFFTVQLTSGSVAFNEDGCNNAVNAILNFCDGNDPKNPMDWKFGGEKQEAAYKYIIGIHRNNRPFPPPTRPLQSCHGQYYGLWSSYDIYGQGWASWDQGQGLAGNASRCIGGGLTRFNMEYYDVPGGPEDTSDNPRPPGGWEWHASFNTPIWTNARCFNNYNVQGGAGGPTDSVYPEKACTGTG